MRVYIIPYGIERAHEMCVAITTWVCIARLTAKETREDLLDPLFLAPFPTLFCVIESECVCERHPCWSFAVVKGEY